MNCLVNNAGCGNHSGRKSKQTVKWILVLCIVRATNSISRGVTQGSTPGSQLCHWL